MKSSAVPGEENLLQIWLSLALVALIMLGLFALLGPVIALALALLSLLLWIENKFLAQTRWKPDLEARRADYLKSIVDGKKHQTEEEEFLRPLPYEHPYKDSIDRHKSNLAELSDTIRQMEAFMAELDEKIRASQAGWVASLFPLTWYLIDRSAGKKFQTLQEHHSGAMSAIDESRRRVDETSKKTHMEILDIRETAEISGRLCVDLKKKGLSGDLLVQEEQNSTALLALMEKLSPVILSAPKADYTDFPKQAVSSAAQFIIDNQVLIGTLMEKRSVKWNGLVQTSSARIETLDASLEQCRLALAQVQSFGQMNWAAESSLLDGFRAGMTRFDGFPQGLNIDSLEQNSAALDQTQAALQVLIANLAAGRADYEKFRELLRQFSAQLSTLQAGLAAMETTLPLLLNWSSQRADLAMLEQRANLLASKPGLTPAVVANSVLPALTGLLALLAPIDDLREKAKNQRVSVLGLQQEIRDNKHPLPDQTGLQELYQAAVVFYSNNYSQTEQELINTMLGRAMDLKERSQRILGLPLDRQIKPDELETFLLFCQEFIKGRAALAASIEQVRDSLEKLNEQENESLALVKKYKPDVDLADRLVKITVFNRLPGQTLGESIDQFKDLARDVDNPKKGRVDLKLKNLKIWALDFPVRVDKNLILVAAELSKNSATLQALLDGIAVDKVNVERDDEARAALALLQNLRQTENTPAPVTLSEKLGRVEILCGFWRSSSDRLPEMERLKKNIEQSLDKLREAQKAAGDARIDVGKFLADKWPPARSDPAALDENLARLDARVLEVLSSSLNIWDGKKSFLKPLGDEYFNFKRGYDKLREEMTRERADIQRKLDRIERLQAAWVSFRNGVDYSTRNQLDRELPQSITLLNRLRSEANSRKGPATLYDSVNKKLDELLRDLSITLEINNEGYGPVFAGGNYDASVSIAKLS